MTDHPVPPSGDIRLAQRRDVPTGLSTGTSVFGDSSPASSLPVALAHSPWASLGHPTWVLVIGRPFAGGVHEARDGACSEQRPSATPGEKTAGPALLTSLTMAFPAVFWLLCLFLDLLVLVTHWPSFLRSSDFGFPIWVSALL